LLPRPRLVLRGPTTAPSCDQRTVCPRRRSRPRYRARLEGFARRCRDAMGIAARHGAHRPAPSRLRWLRERARRPTFSPGWPSFRLLFERARTAAAPDGKTGLGRGKLVIPQRLGRAGSPAVVLSPAPGSPGPPRSEPSTRGSFRKRADFANLK
jgi:hypothetical protein